MWILIKNLCISFRGNIFVFLFRNRMVWTDIWSAMDINGEDENDWVGSVWENGNIKYKKCKYNKISYQR